MQRFVEDLPIGRKIAAVTGGLLTLFAIALLGTLFMMSRASGAFADATHVQQLVAAAESIPQEQLTQRSLQAEFFVYHDEALLQEFTASAARADAGRTAVADAFGDDPVIAKAVAAAAAFDEKHDATVFDRIAPAIREGRIADARAAENEAKGYIVGQLDEGEIVLKRVKGIAAAAESNARAAQTQARIFLVVFALIALGAGVVLSLLLTRVVARPIVAIRARLDEIASGDGDLTQRVNDDRKDEIGALGRAFNRFVEQIQGTCRQVAQSAEALAATARRMATMSAEADQGVEQIAATMDEVARGAGVQSAATQDVTAAVTAIADGTARAADAGREAAEAAGEADRSAADGADRLGEVVSAMERIEATVGGAAEAVGGLGARGEAIGQIVATISDIAAQTNLLALNAAIEAARAGEQGRGFAVVADEVRKLAEESHEAAGSIGGLIAEIQSETRQAVAAMEAGRGDIEGGTGTVAAATEAFSEIRTHVARVTGEVQRVTSVADQLGESTARVSDEIAGVAAVSQENAAAAEQVAAASAQTGASVNEVGRAAAEMTAAADELGALIGRFRV